MIAIEESSADLSRSDLRPPELPKKNHIAPRENRGRKLCMRCPKCRTEVSDWHFYCPNCHTLVSAHSPTENKISQGMVERAGMRLVNVIIGIVVIGALVWMARAIKWNELIGLIRGEAGASTEMKKEPAPRSNSPNVRRKENSPSPTPHTDPGKPEKKMSAESVREMPHKIEELAPIAEPPSSPKPAPTPVKPVTNDPLNSTPVSSAQSVQANLPLRPAREGTELGVEQIEVRQQAEVGYLTINSYTSARIYVDGQFSGVTPRTVKLAPGEHQIRLMTDGYEDWARRIRLNSRQQVGIMASMKKKATAQN